jgi:glycosyltransferase involved in cell wall biosynthesis
MMTDAGKHSIPVSICLTTYNRAAVLPATIDSLLAQTFADFELIISDDGSSDSTEQLCRDYAVRDSRVRYFRNACNLRMPGNLNAAIQRARGEYVANLHDGDIYQPDLIQKWKAALDEQPDAPFVFNAYMWCPVDGKPELVRQFQNERVKGITIARQYFETLTSCVWGTVMARASAYARVGCFNPAFGFLSDVDMWLRLARDATVAYVPEPLIHLTPRETTHPYAFFHWRCIYWQYAMYAANWSLYEPALGLVHTRSQYQRQMRQRFLRGMALSIKYRKWDRVREGLAIWCKSDDWALRSLARIFGGRCATPDWYQPDYWANIRFPGARPGNAQGPAPESLSRSTSSL